MFSYYTNVFLKFIDETNSTNDVNGIMTQFYFVWFVENIGGQRKGWRTVKL